MEQPISEDEDLLINKSVRTEFFKFGYKIYK